MPRHGDTLHRWAGELADDIDPVMVERLMDGAKPDGYTAWERREAVRRLRLNGLCHREIAVRLDISDRQVCRDLERVGLTRTGWQRAQWAEADRRRVVSARLFAAGLRTVEVANLLNVSHGIAHRDRERVHSASTGFNPTAGRSRAELMALYGHLLDNEQEESA